MKTSVIEVRGILSVLSVLGVERRIGEVPGVESVTVNFAAGSATVRCDETRLEIADIKSHVRRAGHESADEPLPRQLSEHDPARERAVQSAPKAGGSLVDESMLTGESMPVKKGPGATVIGATINDKTGTLTIGQPEVVDGRTVVMCPRPVA